MLRIRLTVNDEVIYLLMTFILVSQYSPNYHSVQEPLYSSPKISAGFRSRLSWIGVKPLCLLSELILPGTQDLSSLILFTPLPHHLLAMENYYYFLQHERIFNSNWHFHFFKIKTLEKYTLHSELSCRTSLLKFAISCLNLSGRTNL